MGDLHAFWWRHPRLGREVDTFLDAAALAKFAADYRERYERFAMALGDRLWSGARAVYARMFDARERLYTPAVSTQPTHSPTAMPTFGTSSIHVMVPVPASTGVVQALVWSGDQ